MDDQWRGKRVTVAGLGRFGGQIAVARWLAGQGAIVLVTDQAPPEKLRDSIAQLADVPVQWRLGEHRQSDFTDCDAVAASPAISPDNPYLQAATAAGVAITTEICLFVQRCGAPIIGVTGTKGKSTTTALLTRMLATNRRVFTGGNIGHSLLLDLPAIQPTDCVVLELSSFMLHYLGLTGWHPRTGVITMLAEDHTQWHGTHDAYLQAKRQLLAHQTAEEFAVLNRDNELCRAAAASTCAQVCWFGGDDPSWQLSIPGRHNQLNAHAAYAAAAIYGISRDTAQQALGDFVGLPHRLQLVHQAGQMRFYNDSIATIPQAALAALHSFSPGRVIQVLGGSDKHLPMDAMAREVAGRAKAALCIGATGPAIAKLVREAQGDCAVEECGDLQTAMRRAGQLAQGDDVILLSTGCASYDQFVNFEQRGNEFARLAQQLFPAP